MADPNHTSRPPPHPNPFGYTIVPPPETDMAAQQRNPILDDNLRDDLNSFFDSPDNNASAILQNPAMTAFINNTDFSFDINPGPYSDLNAMPWQFPPPPFDHDASSASVFSDQYNQSLRHSNTNGNASTMPNYSQLSQPTAAPQPSHDVLSGFGLGDDTPEDVVQAATKLFAYTAQKQAASRQSQPAQPSRPSQQPLQTSQSADLSSQSAFRRPLPSHERRHTDFFHAPATASTSSQNYTAAHYSPPNTHFRAPNDTGATYSATTNMSFAGHRHSYPNAQPYQFGSDSNFNQDGYNGPYQPANEQPHIEFARGMAPVRYADSSIASAASSLPQSPIATRQDARNQAQHTYPYHSVKQEGGAEGFDPPNKRRRTIIPSGEVEDSQYAIYDTKSPAVNHQSSSDGNDASPNANSQSSPEGDDADEDMPSNPRKRRKSSSTAQAKASAAARKNLTEEQKRENHIKSEQKRRNIIKDGYKNLNELVPNLKQGGFSKSATLTETVRELETLQQANENSRDYVMERLGISSDDLQAMMDGM